jgi:hypothetical protein
MYRSSGTQAVGIFGVKTSIGITGGTILLCCGTLLTRNRTVATKQDNTPATKTSYIRQEKQKALLEAEAGRSGLGSSL